MRVGFGCEKGRKLYTGSRSNLFKQNKAKPDQPRLHLTYTTSPLPLKKPNPRLTGRPFPSLRASLSLSHSLNFYLSSLFLHCPSLTSSPSLPLHLSVSYLANDYDDECDGDDECNGDDEMTTGIISILIRRSRISIWMSSDDWRRDLQQFLWCHPLLLPPHSSAPSLLPFDYRDDDDENRWDQKSKQMERFGFGWENWVKSMVGSGLEFARN